MLSRALLVVSAGAIAVTGAALVGGCPPSTEPAPDVDRLAVVAHVGAEIMEPAFADLADKADVLEAQTAALCDGGADADKLQSAQDAWKAARKAWKTVEGYRVGPMDELRNFNSIDFWPRRQDALDGYLAGTDAPTEDSVRLGGVAGRGFPVIEYILWHAEDDLMGNLAYLGEGIHCAWAVAAAADLSTTLTTLHNAWSPDDGDFVGTLATSGQSPDSFDSAQTALDLIVNDLIGHVEGMKGIKLNKPLGDRDGAEPDPCDSESYLAHHGLDDLRANLDGFRRAYIGSVDGEPHANSLHQAVADLSDDALADDILAKVDEAEAALSTLPPPLFDRFTDAPDDVRAVRDVLGELHVLLAVDAAGRLGVTLTFNDNDGD